MADIPINMPVSVENARPAPGTPAIRRRVIGEAELKAAQGRLERYKEGKANYDAKVIEGEDWWKLQHWQNFHHSPKRVENKQQNYNAKPVSAWMFNSIMMKHADAMDNYPEPAVLPRAMDDEAAAKTLETFVLEN